MVDSTFGMRLEDPYRWMEHPDNPEFLAWMRSQGEFTRRRLDAIPERARMAQRLRDLSLETSAFSSVQRRGTSLFYMKLEAGSSLAKLVVRDANGSERVLVDPTARAGPGASHSSIDNYSVSWDGKWVAYNLAEGGSEVTRVHILDTATGAEKPDVIEHIWGQFPVVWLPDGTGFFYTQMAEEGFKDPKVDPIQGMRVRRHRLGSSPNDDPLFLGAGASSSMRIEAKEFPMIDIPPGSDFAVAYAIGARPDCRVYVARIEELRDKDARWRRVAEYEDSVGGVATDATHLYLLTSRNAPNRRILRVPFATPDLAAAEEVVPQGERVLVNLAMAKDGLYTVEADRGVHRIFRYRTAGEAREEIPLPVAGAVKDLDADMSREGILFSLDGWTQPGTYYEFRPQQSRLVDLKLSGRSPADYSNIVVERVEVASFDGTMVPLTILRSRTLRLDKSHPAILSGYGAHGTSINPAFSSSRLAWLERGGVVAYAHVRGGGDKGRAWHLAGKGANKGNAVGDFIACAEYLVSKGYTSPSRLAAMGSSGGGPLVGGAIVRRPDLFGAAVLLNAVLNPVRFLHGTNGANMQAELGSPDTEEGLRALVAMDPTLAIRDGVKYPAVLVSVGLNDHRVSPWHSGKFAARLIAARGNEPVFVRVESEAGHGVGSTRNQASELNADLYSFLLWRLGDRAFATN